MQMNTATLFVLFVIAVSGGCMRLFLTAIRAHDDQHDVRCRSFCATCSRFWLVEAYAWLSPVHTMIA
jgi:hypothetical protein